MLRKTIFKVTRFNKPLIPVDKMKHFLLKFLLFPAIVLSLNFHISKSVFSAVVSACSSKFTTST